jgi:hypothetical protein
VEHRTYEPIPEMPVDAVEAAIARNDPDELLTAVLSAALYGRDRQWAQSVCRRLASHDHSNVRGNAILGFGHLARIHGRLEPSVVLPIIEAALVDQDDYVRGQAVAAAEDVELYLGWSVKHPKTIE